MKLLFLQGEENSTGRELFQSIPDPIRHLITPCRMHEARATGISAWNTCSNISAMRHAKNIYTTNSNVSVFSLASPNLKKSRKSRSACDPAESFVEAEDNYYHPGKVYLFSFFKCFSKERCIM